MDQERAPANNSPVLAADPTDERFVVLANRLDAPDFGCELSVSGDGGGSWAPAGAAPALPDGAEKCYGRAWNRPALSGPALAVATLNASFRCPAGTATAH